MKIEPFFLLLVDEDKREFAILGPLADDRHWIDRACEAKQAGRRVRVIRGATTVPKEVHAAAFAQQEGLTYVSNVPF